MSWKFQSPHQPLEAFCHIRAQKRIHIFLLALLILPAVFFPQATAFCIKVICLRFKYQGTKFSAHGPLIHH